LAERFALVLGHRTEDGEFANVVVALDVSNEEVLLVLEVVTDLDDLAAVDVIEVDEDGGLVDREHEVAPEGLEGNEGQLCEVPLGEDCVDVDSLLVVEDVEGVGDHVDVLRVEVLHPLEAGDLFELQLLAGFTVAFGDNEDFGESLESDHDVLLPVEDLIDSTVVLTVETGKARDLPDVGEYGLGLDLPNPHGGEEVEGFLKGIKGDGGRRFIEIPRSVLPLDEFVDFVGGEFVDGDFVIEVGNYLRGANFENIEQGAEGQVDVLVLLPNRILGSRVLLPQ
jgi:hypothetical protein